MGVSSAAMICVELAFTDDPVRLELRPQHRDRLCALHDAGDLVLAGPWEDESGALLVFDCTRAELDRALEEDPYYSAPGVTVASVRVWDPVVGA